MKFWHKTFLATLALFLIAFDIGIFMIADISYKNSVESEKVKDVREHFFISRSLMGDIGTILARGGEQNDALRDLFSSYGKYYGKQGIRLEIQRNGLPVFSNLDDMQAGADDLEQVEDRRSVLVDNESGMLTLYVSGALEGDLSDYTVVYAKDLSDIVAAQEQLTASLLAASVVISAALAVALYFLLHQLSKPIRSLMATTKRIAEGQHGVRVSIKGNDEFAQLGGSFNDMADEIEAQIQELEEQSQQKQQFIDNLAHELRTPLTSISGYADYIQKAVISEEDKIVATDYIMNESNRLKEVAYKLMDMAVLRETSLEMVDIDIYEMIETATATAVVNADKKGVSLRTNVKEVKIKGDEMLLRSMIINLVDNAVKACDEGGIVLVRTYYDAGGYACISIDDNGSGLSEEQINQIMEPFFRVDKARSREQGGAGLGLSLVRQIAKSHNADISYRSELGKGTTVTVRFFGSEPPKPQKKRKRGIDFDSLTLD